MGRSLVRRATGHIFYELIPATREPKLAPPLPTLQASETLGLMVVMIMAVAVCVRLETSGRYDIPIAVLLELRSKCNNKPFFQVVAKPTGASAKDTDK